MRARGGGVSREALIDQKSAVQAEAAALRSEIASLRDGGGAPGRVAELEARLSRLQATEWTLRQQIDRTR